MHQTNQHSSWHREGTELTVQKRRRRGSNGECGSSSIDNAPRADATSCAQCSPALHVTPTVQMLRMHHSRGPGGLYPSREPSNRQGRPANCAPRVSACHAVPAFPLVPHPRVARLPRDAACALQRRAPVARTPRAGTVCSSPCARGSNRSPRRRIPRSRSAGTCDCCRPPPPWF